MHYGVMLKMKFTKSFLKGLLTGVVLCLISLLVYIVFSFEVYPIGGGRFEESKDGKYTAHASNVTDKTTSGEIIEYYQFRIVDNSTKEVKLEHRIFTPREPSSAIKFRGGSGRVVWSDDSRSVSFGSDKVILWRWDRTTKDE